MLFESLKTPYNLVQMEAFFNCVGGVTVVWELILKPWEFIHGMILISGYAVCTVSVGCVTYADSSGLYENGKEG